MIDSAITLMLFAIVLASLLQPNKSRLLPALIFTTEITTHDIFFGDLIGVQYYATAALSSLLVVILLSKIKNINKTVLALQALCVVSILVNALGCLIWFFYISPIFYDTVFVFIYIAAFFVLMRADSEDVRGIADYKRNPILHINNYPGHLSARENKG